jgi:Domain of unknown function (DUF4476)
MNKLILCLLFLVTGLVASSQKVYFVYIQSETDQPFFVKVNQKVNSSTSSGYLILPKLRDTIYNVSIGFPQNKWPEQNFSIAVNNKDHGYLLKNFGEKGWGLFDLQTLAVQMPLAGAVKTETVAKPENKDVSAFTDILSKAADDPSLKEKPVQPKAEEKKPETIPQEIVKKEEPKVEIKEPTVVKPVEVIEKPVVKKEEPKVEVKEPVATKPAEVIPQPVVKKEEPKVEAKEIVTTKPVEIAEKPIEKKEEPKIEVKDTIVKKPVEVIEQPVVKEEVKTATTEEYKKSVIIKKSESSTTEGFGLVFLDDYQNGTKDTIRLLIPNPKPVVAVVKEEPKEEKKFLDITAETPKTEEKKTEVVELPVVKKEEPKTEVKEPVVTKPIATEVTVIKPVVKNNCVAVADESDFFKLRKKMAAAESDDEMISEANKNFKAKCFTVQQVKNLGALFLSDAGKYKFFDAAYTFVSDAENFSSLQAELKDQYYINRFKAMLRN